MKKYILLLIVGLLFSSCGENKNSISDTLNKINDVCDCSELAENNFEKIYDILKTYDVIPKEPKDIKKEDVINLTELTHLNEAIKVYCKNYLFDGANDMDLCESYDRMLLLEKKMENLYNEPRPEAVPDYGAADYGDDGQDLNYSPNRDYDYSPSSSDDYKPQSQ